MEKNIFEMVFNTIESRKSASPEVSYVAKLLKSGVGKINEKITEEAKEVCEAALEEDTSHLVYEICDLLFHSFVLAGYRGIKLSDIESELLRRYGTSGLEEKKMRDKK